jgi:hypothetical protein
MKKLVWIIVVLVTACGGKQQDYRKADDALDAGSEYINACLQGDFSKAAFYVLPGEKNKEALKNIEKQYREKDKEGRQQLRTASINISEVKELPDSSTEIHYYNSFDKQAHTLRVVKQKDKWLVNLSHKN